MENTVSAFSFICSSLLYELSADIGRYCAPLTDSSSSSSSTGRPSPQITSVSSSASGSRAVSTSRAPASSSFGASTFVSPELPQALSIAPISSTDAPSAARAAALMPLAPALRFLRALRLFIRCPPRTRPNYQYFLLLLHQNRFLRHYLHPQLR